MSSLPSIVVMMIWYQPRVLGVFQFCWKAPSL